ncbi:MAG TPA: ABC transporter ATP-binding protein [Acidimicrobiia bacterium]|nr:ABC transporter ATP-binding protein [Acidimicrobiia bacterium]
MTRERVFAAQRDASERLEGIVARRVSKSYQVGKGQLEALRDINLQISSGEFVSLIGPSGCGKSTLLKCIAGLIPITEGQLSVHGQPPTAGRRDVGMMLQSPVLLPWRTVLENVLLPFEIFGSQDGVAKARAYEVLEVVGLNDYVYAYPWQLSGGMQQRVTLARVLAYHPRVLLMDEPFSALDEFTRERLNLEFSEICQKQEEQTTVILVTHSIQEAVSLADRILVMSAEPGRIAGEVLVDLPQPRTAAALATPQFAETMQEVRLMVQRSSLEEKESA